MKKAINYKNIWLVSYPIILSGVAQNIVNVTDTAFLSRYGIVELGAAGNSGILYMVMMMAGFGFAIGCQIVIGRRNGEGKKKQIGELFNTGLFFLIPLALLLFTLVKLFSSSILGYFVSSPNILASSIDYLSVRSFGIFFAFFNYLFIAFYTGTTQTKVLTKTTFLQAGVNVVLDYLFIFGLYGLPEMGVKGAALASVISEIVAMSYFLYFTFRKLDYKSYGLFQHISFQSGKLVQLIKVSAPIMVQNLLAIITWLSFFMIIEQISEEALAISHVVRSIYMVVMIPLFGFSSATSSLVSNLIGEGRIEEVSTLLKKIVTLSLGCTIPFLPLLLFLPREIVSFYSDKEVLLSGAEPVLFIISGAMLLFSIAYILFSGVTGTGKTLHSLAIEFTSIAIYLVFAYSFAIHYQYGLNIVWSSELIYFSLMGALSILYLKFGNWKSSKL